MLDYQKRVVEEKKELDEKIKKLGAFLESDEWMEVEGREANRLEKQYNAMVAYSGILDERIINFK